MHELVALFPGMDVLTIFPFVWSYEEVDYEGQLGPIAVARGAAGNEAFLTVFLEVVWFFSQYDPQYLIVNWAYLQKRANPEYRNRSSERRTYMSDWHTAELLTLRPLPHNE